MIFMLLPLMLLLLEIHLMIMAADGGGKFYLHSQADPPSPSHTHFLTGSKRGEEREEVGISALGPGFKGDPAVRVLIKIFIAIAYYKNST